jgi:hypothetical protein
MASPGEEEVLKLVLYNDDMTCLATRPAPGKLSVHAARIGFNSYAIQA